MISLNIEKTLGFISKENVFAYEAQVKAAQEALENGTGKGNDFLGWLHLPSSITKEHLADLKATAQTLRDNCEVVVVAAIGGSYLGARAVIEALSNSFTWLQDKKTAPVILYAGHNIGEDYLYELTEYLKDKKFGVINISKSGTTTETALAFRLLRVEKLISDEAATRAQADTTVNAKVDSHIGNKSNPHGVTKAQVGLGNVNNTSDADKPVSTAQATAIADAKAAGTNAQTNTAIQVTQQGTPPTGLLCRS